MTYGDIFDFGSAELAGEGAPEVRGAPLRGALARWGDYGQDGAVGGLTEVTPCPVCGAPASDGTVSYRNADGPEGVEAGHGGMWQRARCSDCDAFWAECYYLLGALVDEGPGEGAYDRDVEGGAGARLGGMTPGVGWAPFYRVADGSLLDVAMGVIRAWDAYRGNPSVDIDGAIDALRASVELFGDGPGMVKVRGADVER
jgi:hypothetical protein